MDAWKQYNQIKMLVEKYYMIQKGKRHEDFIMELCDALKI
jgi:hypothetical protein